jgi:penicillin-binding protein 2
MKRGMKTFQTSSERDRQFTRRALILGGGQALLLSGLVARMYYLQVVEADQYRTLAEDNRISMRLLPPTRGNIVDRDGVELAGTRLDYRVVMVPEQVPDVERTLAYMTRHLDLDEDDLARIIRQVKHQRSFLPVTVAENLDWEDFARINVHLADLPGVHPDAGETRSYHNGEAFAHVVGYVSPVSVKDLQNNDDPLLELPGFKIGRSGIERSFDLELRGTAGSSQMEVNAYGRTIRELSRKDSQTGEEVRLTIDADLQSFAYHRMGKESGGAVLMDIRTGDILACVSAPGFDPSLFNVGISQKEWDALLGNIRKPLVNKVVAGQYPPGSTFKTIVGLAALENGIITADDEFFCNGKMTLGKGEFHCWKRQGHGHVNLHHALEQSCDIYFYQVARRVGVEKIAEMARRFGLGQVHDIHIAGQKPGLVPDEAWKLATFGEAWQGGDNLNLGIGQGFLLATPLQLAVMVSRIANGGLAVAPRLVIQHGNEVAPVSAPPIGIRPESMAQIHSGMDAVMNSAHGTGYRSRIRDLPFRMAGKSGSAQVRRITKAERAEGVIDNEDLQWQLRDHALFTAFAPVEAPRYAVAVVVEHGGSGSATAAPMARDLLVEAMKRYMPDEIASARDEKART